MRFLKLLPLLATSLCFAAQADRVAGTIDANQMVRLSGHVHRKALPQYDQGRLPSSAPVNQVMLLTLPTASQQQALRRLVAEQQDPKSPNFHKWITPQQYADRFGLSQNDVQKITTWLKSQGLHVDNVAQGRNWIVFSETVAQVEIAFRTELHRYNVDGETHFANSVMPSVPAGLAGIAAGIQGLDDFHPRPAAVKKSVAAAQKASPNYYDSSFPAQFVAPGDIETIYDLTPLYGATPRIDGTGQKLVIAGQTDVYLADLNNFRSGFGLPAISGCSIDANGVITATACNTSNFQYVLGGPDPGISPNGDVTEADLDLEWSAATAPGAKIIYVNSTDVFVSYYYAIDNNLAPVISLSYGAPCEFDRNVLPADETELTKANSFGITFVNSSGDSGAASCDGPQNSATGNLAVGGLAVSYPASSPEVTAIGGTAITFPGGFGSTYWTTPTTNPTNGGTAQNAPLPETSWNDDAELALAFPSSYSSALAAQQSYAIVQSGGGASNCSVQTSDNSSCVSGFPSPTWQKALSVPLAPANVRYVPDVSLLGSPNFPGYIFCTPLDQWISSSSTASSCAPGGAAGITNALALTDPSRTPPNNQAPTVVGGTSASAPVFAAIVVMLNQYLVANGFQATAGLGNINPNLYYIATNNPSAFHQVTTGDNVVYCQGGTPNNFPSSYKCPGATGTTGSIGFQASNADPTTGYNLVTGLGSVDANTLAVNWGESLTATTTMVVPSTSSAISGTNVTFTATVTPSSATGIVSFYNDGSNTALGTGTVTGGAATFSTSTLPVGANSIVGIYDGINAPSTSSPATVTVTAPYSMSVSPTDVTVPAGQTATTTITITPINGFKQTVNFDPSTSPAGGCTAGVPAGAVCKFSPSTGVTLDGVHSSTVTLTIATSANMVLPSGAQPVTVTGTYGSTTVTATVNLTVTATNQAFMLTTTAATFPVAVGSTATVNVTVANPSAGGGSPIPFVGASSTALPLTYTCGGLTPTLEISCRVSPGNGQPTNTTAVTVSFVTTPKTAQLTPLGGRRIFYAMLLPGLFGIVFAAGARTRGVRLLSLIVVLGLSTLWMGACGGGNGNSSQKNPGTPPGMYPVTIDATTGGATPLTFSLPITLNVQ